MKRILLCLMFIASFVAQTFAVTYTVQGVVKDGETNEPLAFANIIIIETNQGTATSQQGEFNLKLKEGTYTLRCSYVGYKTFTTKLKVDKNIHLIIRMNSIDVLLQNVTVYANQGNTSGQKEVSALSLQSEKMGKITSVIPDVLRSVQMLPGVTADNAFSAKFNVRGGNSDENLVLINGTEVYEPYHVKEAPNASIGIFDVDMIKKMDLITGGFSARYGDRMSSVVNIVYREGDRNHYKGQASLSITDLSALAEGPLGQDGSFIIGARQSYFQYAMKVLDANERLHPSFYDVQGVIAYNLSAQHKLTFKFIHAGDNFLSDPEQNFYGPYIQRAYWNGTYGSYSQHWNDSSGSNAKYYSTMLALKSKDIISSKELLTTEVSYYDQIDKEHARTVNFFRNDFNSTSANSFYQNIYSSLYNNNLDIRTLNIHSSFDLQVNSFYWMKTGLSYKRIFYKNDYVNSKIISELTDRYNYPDTTFSTRNQNQLDNNIDSVNTQSYKAAGYVENVFQIGNKMILNVGGRFDYFDLDKDLTWSPRVNFAYNISHDLTLRGAWGDYYQSPIYQQIAYSTSSDTNTQSQRAIHYIIGLEYNLISDIKDQNYLRMKIEAYHKKYDNLISSTISSSGNIYYSRKNDAIGRASGLDFYMMYSTKGFSGWISYSLLNAQQKLLNSNYGYFPRNTDQRHTLAVYADIDLGKKWDLSTRIMFGSGFAYTPSVAVYNDSSHVWQWKIGNPNSEHMPTYKRVDMRLSKNFEFFNLPASAFLDISNIFNFKNVQSYEYTFSNGGKPIIKDINLWPILPTFGLTVKF